MSVSVKARGRSPNEHEDVPRKRIRSSEAIERNAADESFQHSASEGQSDRVAFTPPGFLKRRECRPQSQPQALQYHSVIPSHSSRSAAMARPESMECWSAGVMGSWTTGIIWSEPHSGQMGVVFFRRDGRAGPWMRFERLGCLARVISDIPGRDRNVGRPDAAARGKALPRHWRRAAACRSV